ncbi:MtrB/PioB family decaheme-associated outer membrane protein [Alteromonadaceae bacterium 2753L.S.0a.02]|nr:MtrB/PioB family decaheme-associated outer membrane protein [Alteromonadaceae bacterium 2753L.S.0a.02]
MTKSLFLSLSSSLVLLPLLSVPALADTSEPHIPTDLDISKWQCKYCEFEEGFSAWVELGATGVSDTSAKFGEYNGLYEDGAYARINANASSRSKDGHFFDMHLRDLGLDTRQATFSGGRQGKYEFYLDYDELTQFKAHDLLTPYSGSGSDYLTLPADWVPVSTSSEVGENLNAINLKTKRQRLDLGALFIPAKHWETSLDVRHEVRDGELRTAAPFYFKSVEVANPVDYVTDELEAAATYTVRNWQSRISYFASQFSNNYSSLRWQNAYGPIVPGADQGELALAPDNQFQQLRLTSGYTWGRTRIYGDVASGQMQQNVDLLAPTLNDNLMVDSPSQDSIDARVDTLNANLRISSAVTRKLQLKASYRLDDRDNKTDSLLYTWVSSDAYVNPVERRNLPYSFRTERLDVEANYRVQRAARLSAGFEQEDRDRTHQEVDSTREETLWGKLRLDFGNAINLDFRIAESDRDASGYNTVSDITPGQNPLMRKYYMADRKRLAVHGGANFFIHEQVSLDVSIDTNRDTYTDSPIGLSEAEDLSENVDLNVAFTSNLSGHVFGSWQKIRSQQNGSASFSEADWRADNKDRVNTYGAGLNYRPEKAKLKIGADYVLSDASTNIAVDSSAPDSRFPENSSKLQNVTAFMEYQINSNLAVFTEYTFEVYRSKNWATDDVTTDTLHNVISLGYPSPEYDVHVLSVSARYRF